MQYYDVVVITNPRWRTAVKVKIVILAYLSEKLSTMMKFGTLSQIGLVTMKTRKLCYSKDDLAMRAI